jgi:ligand-binding sensor domain-containing protein/putative methionine-R-sulfoxide reductase with GAF domain
MLLSKFLVAFLLLISIDLQAQSRYRFHTLGMEQGLTSNIVWSISKDKVGYVWMATQNGLNRYDGHDIKQYFHNDKDSFSIPGNVVYWIHKDVDGGLWFSFGTRGVARYNYAKDRFEKFQPYDSIRKKKNYAARMWHMGNDHQGRIYFGNGGSCFRYSLRTQKMEDLTPLFNGLLEGHEIGTFVTQGKDVLWITSNNGLFRYDLLKNKILHFPFDAKKFGFGDANMHDAEFINDHQLLVAVVRTGFVLFDTHTETFSLPPAPINPSQSRLFSETGGVLKDANGRIWLANSRYGLLEYFPKTNTVYSLKNESSYPYPYTEQEGSGLNVYEDDDGTIWYGSSYKGVTWFNPQLDFLQSFPRDFSKSQSLPHNYVSYFLPMENDLMLIGTGHGVTAFNKKTGSFKNFPVAYNDDDVFPHVNIRGMVKHGDSVFISTGYGLSVYQSKTGKFSRFLEHTASFDSTFIYGQWLLHYIDNKVFVSGDNMVRFDVQTRRYEYATSRQNDPLDSLNNINASLYDAEKGLLWLEAGINNLYSYQVQTKKLKKHEFTTDSVIMIDAIQKDRNGKLWLGTYNGLYVYDPATGKGERIELNTTAKAVYNIAIQNDQYIWLATPNEVVRYDRKAKTIELLPSHLLFANSTINKRAFLLDDEDKLWVGTTLGFAMIDTRRFQTKNVVKEPQLVSFSVFDKPRVFENPLSNLDKITLSHNENFFSFSFSAFNYHAPVEYSFMLEGFDKNWQTAKGNSGSYTNVPPGTYRLYIKSTNESIGWKERSLPIIIHIKPPFWQTLWFISLLIILTALLAAFIYRRSQRRRRKKQVENTIDYFANSMFGENSITEICWDIARSCSSQLKLEDCVVYLFDEQREVLIQRAAYGAKNPKEQEIINPLVIKWNEGIVGTAAFIGKPVLVKDLNKDKRYIVDDVRRNSELAVPIIHEGKVIGVIDSEHSRKNFFTEEHVKALSTIAAISANKIAEAKAEEAAKISEIKFLEIQKLLAETQLMALRAQMNPHFVFNCLNSIQECIVTEKYGEASLYLNKFSKLFRSVLNNSSKAMIPLADEIEVLELYLTLEEMRFEKSFQYKIHISEDLETDEILIPSMLLQPFVENALWHGLMHKQEDRQLNIYFKKQSEDVFQCVVDDNGIGRKRALELKEEQSKTKRHVSKGMSICKDRIDLLQKQGYHALLQIVDKSNDNGEPTGTKVIIELSSYLK